MAVVVSRAAPTGWWIYAPDGAIIPPCGPREPGDGSGIEVLERRARAQDLHIDAMTAYPDWDGEPMDYELAIDGLVAVSAPPL